MESYKVALQRKLRFQTNKGSLSLEQLFDLSLEDLDKLAVSLQEAYDNSKGKSFLTKRSVKDKDIKLQFDIALDVLQTKAEEIAAQEEVAENKKHNQKILGLIAEKKEDALKGKSIKELENMLK